MTDAEALREDIKDRIETAYADVQELEDEADDKYRENIHNAALALIQAKDSLRFVQ